jgi:plastocyanin
VAYRGAMTKRAPRYALAVAWFVALSAFAGPALARDKFVTMYANEFRPRTVTINAGDKVTWVNDDDVEHDAVGNGWSTSLLGYYERASVRFNRAGTYRYHCSIHPTMRGTVVVRGASGGAGGGGVTPDTATAALDVREDGGWTTTVLGMLAVVTIAGTVAIDRLLRRRSASRA